MAKKDWHELLKQIDVHNIDNLGNEELFEEMYELDENQHRKPKPKPKREDWE